MRRAAKLLLVIAGLGLASFLLHRIFSRYGLDEIVAAVEAIPLRNLILSAVCAGSSYLCLTGFDWLAIRYLGHRIPYRKVAFTSFVSLSIGHNVGIAALSSGAIRYRFYTRWGLRAVEVAKLILFCALTVAFGFIVLGGFVLLLQGELAARFTGSDRVLLTLVGILCLAVAGLYVAAAALSLPPLKLGRFALEFPKVGIALGQVGLGPLNFLCVAGCLHFALQAETDAPYLRVVSIYLIANLMGLISHVPGGLGVIEATVMFLVGGAQVIGGLIVFRATYFVLPFLIGTSLFAIFELRALVTDRRKRAPRLDVTPAKTALPDRAASCREPV